VLSKAARTPTPARLACLATCRDSAKRIELTKYQTRESATKRTAAASAKIRPSALFVPQDLFFHNTLSGAHRRCTYAALWLFRSSCCILASSVARSPDFPFPSRSATLSTPCTAALTPLPPPPPPSPQISSCVYTVESTWLPCPNPNPLLTP